MKTWESWYHKDKKDCILMRRDYRWGWQLHQLDDMQTICTSLQAYNHTNTSSLPKNESRKMLWGRHNQIYTRESTGIASTEGVSENIPLVIIHNTHCNYNHNKTSTTTSTHPFNGPLCGTTRVSQYQKGKSNLDFTEARESEWQWHQLGHMQVCTSLQTDNHASTPPLSFLQARCPSCRPTNSIKALKAKAITRPQ